MNNQPFPSAPLIDYPLYRFDEIDAAPVLEGHWLIKTLTWAFRGELETARTSRESPVVSAALDARPGTGAQVYAVLGDAE